MPGEGLLGLLAVLGGGDPVAGGLLVILGVLALVAVVAVAKALLGPAGPGKAKRAVENSGDARKAGAKSEERPRPRRLEPILAAPPEGLKRELDHAVAAELWRAVKRGVEDGLVHVKLTAPGCNGYVAVDLSGELLCVEGDRVRPLRGKAAPVIQVDEPEDEQDEGEDGGG